MSIVSMGPYKFADSAPECKAHEINLENNVTDTQYKKELLFRKDNGKRIQKNYFNEIRTLIKTEDASYQVLELSSSDDILRRSVFIHGETIKSTIEPSEISEVIAHATQGASVYDVYLDEGWMCCGAFGPIKPDLFRNDFRFGSVIMNDILLIEENFDRAIALDCYEVANQIYIDMTIHRNQSN